VVPMACVSFGTYELVRGAMVRAESGGIRALLPRRGRRRQPFALPPQLRQQKLEAPEAPALCANVAAVPAATSVGTLQRQR